MSDKVSFQQRWGEQNGRAKLTRSQADKIRESKLSCRTLADQYGVSMTVILKIKRGLTWPASTSKN